MGLISLINKGMDKIRAAPTVIKLAVFGGYAYVMSVACIGKNYFGGIMGPVEEKEGITFGVMGRYPSTVFSGDNVRFWVNDAKSSEGKVTGDLYLNDVNKGTMTNIGNTDDLEKFITIITPKHYEFFARLTDSINTKDTGKMKFGVYMNEQQSDAGLLSDIAARTNSSSTTQYDILAHGGTNVVMNLNGTLYTNDIWIRIRDPPPGGARDHIIDIQGSENDTYNAAKKADANAAGFGYAHIGKVKTQSDINTAVQQIKNNSWPW